MQTEPVLEINDYGTKRYRLNGKRHREDGPAVEWANGDKEWWIHGELHRTDGPAIEYASGDKYWRLNNIEYGFEQWLELTPISDQEKLKLRLKYAK